MHLQPTDIRPRRIGFVATRFAGTDGVSLEAEKWAQVLERMGHTCYYFTGLSDRPSERTMLVPEALFTYPDVRSVYISAFTERIRLPRLTRLTHDLAQHLKAKLAEFVLAFDIDLLLPQNALTIPMNIPLGLALTEYIAETGIPVVAHHHDFYWERQRYLVNSISDYLRTAFPPDLPSIKHVVINSQAASQLSLRAGISAMLIPNVMDFEHPPAPADGYVHDLRRNLNLSPDERLYLQPTRIVQRKGIEHAIELTKRMGLTARLVVSHASGDERDDYERRVRDYAEMLGVSVNFVSDIIRHERGLTPDGRKIYALGDVYHQADLVTYPSTIEGFGNAFLEAIYFRRPVVVNNYSIFDLDIKPKGFRVIQFDGYVTADTVRQAREVVENADLAAEMAEHNYQLGLRYYAYDMLERHLRTLLTEIFGELS
jgi:mannosylglucosylglycerate synthase